jgi:subtilase family serine protease
LPNQSKNPFFRNLLKQYFAYFKIKPTGPAIQRIPIEGGPPRGLSSDSIETELDIQTIRGTSPGVALSVYETSDLSFTSIVSAYNQIDADATVTAVNSSFGGCEYEAGVFPQIADYLAQQGAAEGIIFSASTGDDGAFCDGNLDVETPASAPTFVGVGGTTLFLNPYLGKYRFENGWAGSGGGTSSIFPTPSYQLGIPNVIGSYRNVPDIAFDADPGSGESLYIGGQWIGPVGGTSLASPLFVGLLSQWTQIAGSPLAEIQSPVYRTFTADGYRLPAGHPLFHDWTLGNDGYYSAQPGYDLLTGIGSIDGWNYATLGQL